MKFSKMHGIGNDYIYVNCFEEFVENPVQTAIFVSDRRFGIGGDGLILIKPSEVADFKMEMYNADGSEGMMCGNGTRCIGKYVYDRKLTDKKEVTLETKSGIKKLQLFIENDLVQNVKVDMGKAILTSKDIPINSDLENYISKPILIDQTSYNMTCVSMGNPHAVIFTEDVDSIDLEKLGPKFENHTFFPNKVNTEFVEIIDSKTLKMRVWERGSGETYACGTGACASVVAAVLNNICSYDTDICIHLRGGDLVINYQKDGTVLMTGSATHVFDGEIFLNL